MPSKPAQTASRPPIFDGLDVRVTDGRIEGDDALLVISFPSYRTNQSFANRGFAERWLAERRISAVEVKASWNHWMQVPDTEPAMAAIKAIAGSYRRVVTYGSSMGGYAAAACSAAVGAHAVVAISPQYSIDPAKTGWDKRWLPYARTILGRGGFIRDDMATQLAPDAALHIIADPWNPDAEHAALIGRHSLRPEGLLALGCGHSAAAGLRDFGLLGSCAVSLLRGTESVGHWRRQLRARRAQSHRYWRLLGERQILRGARGQAGALAAAVRCAELAFAAVTVPGPPEAVSLKSAAVIQRRLSRTEDALAILERLASTNSHNAATAGLFANIWLDLRRLPEAREWLAEAERLQAPPHATAAIRQRLSHLDASLLPER